MNGAELELIEAREGTDGWRYFAQRAGTYEGGIYWWFVWRVPIKDMTASGQPVGDVMTRANSIQDAEAAARAFLDTVVP